MRFTAAAIIFALPLALVAPASAAWDPGGNTPPNANEITRQAHVSQPIEPRADTTREGLNKGSIGSQ